MSRCRSAPWCPGGFRKDSSCVKAARMILEQLPNFSSSRMEAAAGSVGGLMPASYKQ